jgi:hypothetical protein
MSRNARRAVAYVRAAAERSFPRIAPFTKQAPIPQDRFRYGRVKDVVMRRLESGANRLEKRSIKELPIANCRLPIQNRIDRTKSAIGNRQLAIT